jgi:predicted CXXCH cytochrome family protein
MKEMRATRRWLLLMAGGALWLLLAATPAFADGGPHVLANNNGTSGLAGDCAACHRAHTAQAADLLKEELPGLCVSCHNGTGATTDVVDGIQYVPDTDGTPTTGVLGALRGGGFTYALIDSGSAARIYSDFPIVNRGHVGVLAVADRQPTTSKHEGEGTVWGNGAIDSGPGPATGSAIVLDCARCHNPHGNGFYRILNPEPGEDFVAPFEVSRPGGVEVTEATPVTLAAGQVRNYTVLPGNLTSDVVTAGYTATQGDYWRRYVPDWRTSNVRDPMQTGWTGSSPTTAAQNGGTPPSAFTGLMTAWCLQCHTRYAGLPDLLSGLPPALAPTDDDLFKYRHDTVNLGCEQCHVSHGSNAVMEPGTASADMPWPAWPPAAPGTGNADSRLLKIDNRGTCQMCHDPTGTVSGGTYSGPIPSPSAP